MGARAPATRMPTRLPTPQPHTCPHLRCAYQCLQVSFPADAWMTLSATNNCCGAHPIHLHLIDFYMCQRTNPTVSDGMRTYETYTPKDIFLISPRDTVTGVVRMGPSQGNYMWVAGTRAVCCSCGCSSSSSSRSRCSTGFPVFRAPQGCMRLSYPPGRGTTSEEALAWGHPARAGCEDHNGKRNRVHVIVLHALVTLLYR